MYDNDRTIFNRQTWIDFLKGIGILLVVAGHSSINSNIKTLIYFFHMPLFFIISGYLEKGSYTKLSTLLQEKAKVFLYPYFSFGILIILYNSLYDYVNGSFTLTKLGKRWVALLYGNYIWENNSDYIGTLWFLVALYCTKVLFGLILHFVNRKQLQLITTVGIGCIGFAVAAVESQQEFRLPWCLDIALIACVFYGCGYFWKEFSSNKQFSGLLGILFVALGIIFGGLNNLYMIANNYKLVRPDMIYLNFGFVPFYLLAGILCSLGGMVLCKNFKHTKVFITINHCGRNSLIIMVVHLYVMNILNRIGVKIGLTNSYVILLETLIVSYILGCIIEKYFTPIYKIPIRKNK